MKHGKLVTSILVLSLAAVTAAFASMAEARSLEQIKASGELLVGSTGDYKPMSYLNKETGKYEGFDAEMAQSLAKYLGVKLKYVPTTWKTLQADTMADKFDVAMSGITVTDARKKVMTMSDGYLTFEQGRSVQRIERRQPADCSCHVQPGRHKRKVCQGNDSESSAHDA